MIQQISCIQIQIYEKLSTHDQSSLIIINELSNIIKTDKIINNKQFTCLTILPYNLNKRSKLKSSQVNITYRYQGDQQDQQVDKQSNMNNKEINKQANIIGYYQDYKYSKILDLLHGSCATYQTEQFIYQYCHKQKVRQFDSIITKHRMNKQKYQDITMGYWNYIQIIQQSNKPEDQILKEKIKLYDVNYDQKGNIVLRNKQNNKNKIGNSDNKYNKDKINEYKYNKNTNKDGLNKQNSIPIRSVIYDKDNLFTVQTVNHKLYQLDKSSGIIHTNYIILQKNSLFYYIQYTYQVYCSYISQNKTHQIIVSQGRLLTSYDLLFLGDINKCDTVVQLSRTYNKYKYNYNPQYIYSEQIRWVRNYLYGNDLDNICTNNWEYDMTKSKSDKFIPNIDHSIKANSTLMITLNVNISGEIRQLQHVLIVSEMRKTLPHGVIKVEQNIDEILQNVIQKHNKNNININKLISSSMSWISTCKILSTRAIQFKSQSIHNKFINNKLIKFQHISHNNNNKLSIKQPGDQLLCLCLFRKYIQSYLQMHITLGNKLFQSQNQIIFEYYHQQTVRTKSKNNKQMYQICEIVVCYDYRKEQKKQQQGKNNNNINKLIRQQLFTQISKLTKQNPIYFSSTQQQSSISIKQQSSISSSILSSAQYIQLFQLSPSAILLIHTFNSLTQQNFTYLITSQKILKIQSFKNNSISITNQNKFYQNSTYSSDNNKKILILYNNIMYRLGDKIIFPRINMGKEQIIKVERMKGNIYVRKWNINVMNQMNKYDNQNIFIVENVKQFISKHYQIQKYPIHQQQQQTKSINNNNIDQQQQQQSTQSIKKNNNNNNNNFNLQLINFSESYHKGLNRSIILKYEYFHGQFCPSPINKHRSTTVQLKCGQSYMQIDQVLQLSPCVYQLKVSTRFLCNLQQIHNHQKIQKYEDVQIDKIVGKNIYRSVENNIKQIKKTHICYKKNIWDNVKILYNIDKKDIQYVLQ